MDAQQIILLVLQLAVLGTVLGFGLKARPADLLYLLHRPGLLARSLLAVLVVVPVLAVLLVKTIDMELPIRATLVALAISPVPPLLPRKQGKAGGAESYGLGLMILLALLAIVAIPLTVLILELVFHRDFDVAPGRIAHLVIMSTILPLSIGMAVRAIFPAFAARLQPIVRMVSIILLLLGTFAMLAGTWGVIWRANHGGAVFAIAALVIAGLAVGHFLGGPEPEHSTVLALSAACRHPAIALTVVSTAYPEERFAGVILLYLLVSAVLCIPYVAWVKRRMRKAEAPATS